MSRSISFLVLIGCFALVAIGEPTVLAAPPANDLRSAAATVGIGSNFSLDTSEATTDADDTYWNGIGCNLPATDASVWYQFVGTGETFRIEVYQSDYTASVQISEGYTTFGCGIGGIDFVTFPGQTYYMMVVDDQRDGVGNGGIMNLSISLAPTPPPQPNPTLTLDVSRFGIVSPRTGVATISGLYSCMNADTLHVRALVWQLYGHFSGSAYNFDIAFQAACDGNLHAWSADLYPSGPPERRLHGGRAMTAAFAYSTGPYGGSPAVEITDQDIILRGH